MATKFEDDDFEVSDGKETKTAKAAAVEEGLRLKRAKPLKDKESTLDTVMNIKIGGGRRAT